MVREENTRLSKMTASASLMEKNATYTQAESKKRRRCRKSFGLLQIPLDAGERLAAQSPPAICNTFILRIFTTHTHRGATNTRDKKKWCI